MRRVTAKPECDANKCQLQRVYLVSVNDAAKRHKSTLLGCHRHQLDCNLNESERMQNVM